MVAAMKASSDFVAVVGLGLGESAVRREHGDFLPGDHHFGALVSSISSHPDLSSRVNGRGCGVLSEPDRDTILGACLVLRLR